MGSAKGCFKYGCGGCFVLLLIGLLAIGGLSFFASRVEHRIERLEFAQELPVGTAPPGFLGEDSPGAQEPALEGTSLPSTALTESPGRLELDLALGSFKLSPGEPGEPLRVIADFDVGTFEIEESFLPARGDQGWVYRVAFGPKYGPFSLLTGGKKKDNPAEVEILIPPDASMDIVGTLGIGETLADLGGLSLRQVRLELGTGDHTIVFSEPNRGVLERLELRKSIGALAVRGLGFASPEEIRIEQKLGELQIGLDGPWRNDASLEARLKIGEIELEDAPDDIRYDLEGAGVSIGEHSLSLPEGADLAADAPTLRLRLSAGIGELHSN